MRRLAFAAVVAAAFAGIAFAQTPDTSAAPANQWLVFETAAASKVVEPAEPIDAFVLLTNTGEASVTVVKAADDQGLRLPISWVVSDAAGNPVTEAPAGKAAGTAIIPGAGTSGVLPLRNRFALSPPDAWREGNMKLRASYAVTSDMYAAAGGAAPANAFVGTLTSQPVEIVVKPAGWRMDAYRAYSKALESVLCTEFRKNEFEFPDLREARSAEFTEGAASVTGRFLLPRERLQIDSANKTARLVRVEGRLDFIVHDLYSPQPPDALGRMTVGDGLIAVDLVIQCENKWLVDKLKELLPDLTKALDAANPLSTPALDSTDTAVDTATQAGNTDRLTERTSAASDRESGSAG